MERTPHKIIIEISNQELPPMGEKPTLFHTSHPLQAFDNSRITTQVTSGLLVLPLYNVLKLIFGD